MHSTEAVPTLVQLLQAENKPARLLLVELLAQIPDRVAGAAWPSEPSSTWARRSVRRRPGIEPPAAARSTATALLDGFRYPWAPVADHAAEALVALQDVASCATPPPAREPIRRRRS